MCFPSDELQVKQLVQEVLCFFSLPPQKVFQADLLCYYKSENRIWFQSKSYKLREDFEFLKTQSRQISSLGKSNFTDVRRVKSLDG